MLEQHPTAITLQDNTGHAYSVRPYDARDLRAVEQFYAEFEPKRGAQGLPPGEVETIHRWLARVLASGRHLLVLIDEAVMGHLMLMPIKDQPEAFELANFIHQSVRNRGIGTMLNTIGAGIAHADGKSRVWLSVEPSNKVAIRSYEKAGFRRLPGSLWAPEIEMELPLVELATVAPYPAV